VVTPSDCCAVPRVSCTLVGVVFTNSMGVGAVVVVAGALPNGNTRVFLFWSLASEYSIGSSPSISRESNPVGSRLRFSLVKAEPIEEGRGSVIENAIRVMGFEGLSKGTLEGS